MTEQNSSYFASIQQYKAEFWDLFLAAFKDGLRLVSEAKDSGKYIGTHFDVPTLTFRENGLPQLSSTISTGPVDYSGCFTAIGEKPHNSPL